MKIPHQIRTLLQRLPAQDRLALIVGMLAMLAAGTLSTLPALLLGQTVDETLSAGWTRQAAILCGLIFTCIVIAEVSTLIQRYIVESVSTRLWHSEFSAVVDRLAAAPLGTVQKLKAGDVAIAAERGAQAKVKMMKLVFIELLPNLVVAGVSISLAIAAHWSMAIVLPAVAILTGLVTARQLHTQQGVRDQLERGKESLGGTIARTLIGMAYLRGSGLVRTAAANLNETAGNVQTRELSHHRSMTFYDAVKRIVQSGGFFGAIGLAIYLSVTGHISSGQVLTLAVLFDRAMAPIQHLHRIFDELQISSSQSQHLTKLQSLDRPGEAHLSYTDLDFSKPPLMAKGFKVDHTGSEVANVAPIELTIREGEWVALTGPSGCGKTTFMTGALGLYQQYTGSLELYGAPVNALQRSTLSSIAAYCPQEPFIFPDTIRENVACAAKLRGQTVTDEEIKAILHDVGLGQRLLTLPHGLDEHIHEFGGGLSGGEQQRLMIARTLLCQSDLYLFDECTAHLNEGLAISIMQTLRRRLAHKTCVFIMHQPRLLDFVDRTINFGGPHLQTLGGSVRCPTEQIAQGG